MQTEASNAAGSVAEDRFQAIFEAAGVGMAEVDPESFSFLRVNRPLCEALGYRDEELLGRSSFSITHPDDLQIGRELLEEMRVGRRASVAFEKRYLRRDGGSVWFLVHATRIPGASGGPPRNLAVYTDVTALREAEAALRGSQEALGLAMKGGRMGWWVRNLLTEEVTWSPELEHIFGLRPGSFQGTRERFLDLLHPEDRERHSRAVADAIAERRDYAVEFRFRRTDGSEGWMEGRGRAVYDPSGRPVSLYGIGIDVTQRRESEEALRRSGETFESLVRNSPFGVYVVDADFRLALVSQGARKVFENVRPLIGRDFAEVLREIWPEPFATEAIDRFRHTLATGEPYHSPSTVERRRDIEEVESYDWKTERISLPDGRLGVVCHFYDLSERQRYERALRESEERFRLAVEAARLGTWDFDVESGVTQYSEAVGPMFGRPRQPFSMTLEEWTARVHPDDLKPVIQAFEAMMESDAPYRVLARAIQPDGSVRWVEASGMALRDESGRAVRAIGVIADVTLQREAEAALQQREADYRRELEHTVHDRTAELRASNEALQGFTYHVSHDLRAPLRAIASTSRMIQEDYGQALPPEAHSLLARQAEAANKLGQLIDDLLKLSRLSREEIDRRPLDFSLLAREAAAEALATHPRSSVEIDVQENLEADADARLLRLAVQNLIDNAVKYSPQGGRVRVGQGPDGAYFVADVGIGIPAQYLERIFEPFQRLHRDEEYKGTGIGLTNVRQVITRHGGRLWVESEPGQGSTFYFTLS